MSAWPIFGNRRKKILSIDDDILIHALISDVFEAAGYEVLSANDGASGCALAKKERPDLIFLDVRMPGLNGFQTLDLLKASPETKDIPVIMSTAEQRGADIEDAFKLGAVDYIIKPLELDRLREKVSKFLPPAA
jgi:CheY-like chemotaxis protein